MKSEELLSLKSDLLAACEKYIKDRIKHIDKAISSAQSAANQETKSSAGDKYETGRAMMQLETENNAIQLSQALEVQKVLKQINVLMVNDKISLGSLAYTNIGNYFLSISAGAVTVGDDKYFAVSLGSPIGKVLAGHSPGDVLDFNGRKIEINAVY